MAGPSWRKALLPKRLQYQVGVIVSALLIGTIGLYAWRTAVMQSSASMRAIESQATVMGKSIANLSMNYLLTEDYASMQTLLLKIAEFPDVLSISVARRNGAVLSRVVHPDHAPPRAQYDLQPLPTPSGESPVIVRNDERIIVWHPIIERTPMGWVAIEYSLRSITDLRKRIWRDTIIAALLVLTASAGLILVLLNRPLQAIRQLTNFAKRMDEERGATVEVDAGAEEIAQLASALNTTSTKLLEQERLLRESAEHLERLRQRNLLILHSAGEGIVGLDLNGNHIFVNSAASRILGYGVDELIGCPIRESWYRAPDDRPIYATLQDGEMHRLDDEFFQRKDGTSVPVSYTTTPIREGGRLTGAVVTFRDITERRRAEEALRESEKKYRTLFEESKDVILFGDLDGQLSDINPAGVELFRYSSKDEMQTIDIRRDLFHSAEDWAAFGRVISRQGFVNDFEVTLKKKDGSLLDAMITAAAVCDDAGALSAYRGILRDVTSERRLAQQLRHAQKMEAVGQLTGGIAHDFNNILSAIMSYGYLLQTKIDEHSESRVHVDHLLLSAERGANLTQSLLTFSRKQIMNPKPVDIHHIIRNVEKLLVKLMGEDIALRTLLAEDPLIVVADSGQVEQVLMNFATNARDAMPRGGTFSIETGRMELGEDFSRMHGYGGSGMYACIAVSDTGAGMDRQTVKKIFEPFFTTKELGKGTGLGLSIVYGIIKQHNGYINVYSEPGAGTTFRVYLPLSSIGEGELRPEDFGPVEGGTETILVAEDDDDVRRLARVVLREYGYKLIEARDGEEAIHQFNEHRDSIDLLILDVVMPKRNGKDVLEEIQRIK
ncbi:MAG TPA: PAS domain S-box protein, partial [Nitrospirota bacterium]